MGRWMASALAALATSALAAGAQDRSVDARSMQLAADQTTATSLASAKNRPVTQSAPTIVIDQFGYPPAARKVAVVRSPEVGFDAGHPFRPGDRYLVVNARTGETAFAGEPKPWRSGQSDPSSGDRVSWFDFSPLTREGTYYILDQAAQLRSPVFRIADDVYRDVLKQAVRTFFYQRAGFKKEPKFAGPWADAASHLGPRQDRNARLYSRPSDPATARDLSGGWYDAGDYNKYTSWTSRYIMTLLKAYEENPSAFTDDYGLPESGNGVPDIVDEAKWGLDWLERMQNADGSVLSVVALSQASPPSAARGPSLYGPSNTSATLSAAATYAFAATVLEKLGQGDVAQRLDERAKKAYDWAEAHPDEMFRNNDSASGTAGLASGQQETDDYGRLAWKVAAAVFLFERTGEDRYREVVDRNYSRTHLMEWSHADPFDIQQNDDLLRYARLPSTTESVAVAIRRVFVASLQGTDYLQAVRGETDPYRAYTKHYTWGSNRTKSDVGTMFFETLSASGDAARTDELRNAALGYVNYLHGVNPLGLVYLSNMGAFGAERSVSQIFHAWFVDGDPRWDEVGRSTDGPPPGFLVGGPNPGYDWDACCPGSCGSAKNNALCTSESIVPPKNQPPQKSYKDFNTGWPLDSWSVSENSNGYQAAYIRLLSKFVLSH